MASNTETQHIEVSRKFGYCEIKWQIENYLSATCQKNWIIDSPEFSVRGSVVTKWRLLLKPRYVKDRYAVDVLLHRVESDCFRDTVRVRWKLLYFADDIEHMIAEASSVFERKNIFALEIQNIKAIEQKMRRSSNDFLTIRCVMIVFDKDGAKCFYASDLGLKALSQDMAVLFRLNKKFDTSLKIGDNKNLIRGHKAILCARNRVLKSEILKKEEPIPIYSAGIRRNDVENICSFLYSGNLEYVLRMPSFSMHLLIDYLRIGELKHYFLKDELIIKTTFECQEIITSWFIPSSRLTENEILSDTWKVGFINTSFRLHLDLKGASKEKQQNVKYQAKPAGKENKVIVLRLADSISPKKNLGTDKKVNETGLKQNGTGQAQVEEEDETTDHIFAKPTEPKDTSCDVDEKADYVSVCCEFVNGIPPKEAYLTYSVYCEDIDFIVMEGVNSTLDKDNKLILENFFARRMLNEPKFLLNDQLAIVSKLRIPSGTKKQCVLSSKVHCMDHLTDDYHYEKLSNKLKTVFETANYSDLVITARVITIPVHRIILSTRSYVLSKLIADLNDERELHIEDIDVDILQILLKYIYTGVLEDYRSEDVKYIYAAAAKYGLWSLKYTCSGILQRDIDLNNALEILVLAHANKEIKLKNCAFKFIYHHMDEVQLQDNWDSFLDENPQISKELVEFGRKYVKAVKEK